MEKKYLVVKHPMEMHDRHDIFYVVNATILLHNMMVEVRMGQGELESSEYYITEPSSSSETGEQPDMTYAERNDNANGPCDNEEENENENKEESKNDDNFVKMKYLMTQKRWKQLYDANASLRLQDSVKMQLYSERYEDVELDPYEVAPDFDPLKF